MHTLISTDTGTDCYSCGATFDIYPTDDDGLMVPGSDPIVLTIDGEDYRLSEGWVPCLSNDGDAHHWTAGPDGLDCAFCPVWVRIHTRPMDIPRTCNRES